MNMTDFIDDVWRVRSYISGKNWEEDLAIGVALKMFKPHFKEALLVCSDFFDMIVTRKTVCDLYMKYLNFLQDKDYGMLTKYFQESIEECLSQSKQYEYFAFEEQFNSRMKSMLPADLYERYCNQTLTIREVLLVNPRAVLYF